METLGPPSQRPPAVARGNATADLLGADRIYGLDIETDTAIDGLDPRCSPILAVGLSGEGWSTVFAGSEDDILADLDSTLAELPNGVIVTWNGARFDLPFLADRSFVHRISLGLTLLPDPHTRTSRAPLPGHLGGYLASWNGHRHLDAYAVYRADVGASVGLPCGLKPLAKMLGYEPVEVETWHIHDIDAELLHRYVASDAELARALAMRRWPTAQRAIDVVPVLQSTATLPSLT